MWTARVERLESGSILRYEIWDERQALTYFEILPLWFNHVEFRRFFVGLLKDIPFEAYRFETPPLCAQDHGMQFEFVAVDWPQLIRPIDVSTFAGQFTDHEAVVDFRNLGDDATLIVPNPRGEIGKFGHLASFMRHGDDAQIHGLWQRTAQCMVEALGHAPIWLNTAGMGVSYLHLRLDDRPKYYIYGPYK